MKLYKTAAGIVVQQGDEYHLVHDQDWDVFVNDDQLYLKLNQIVSHSVHSSTAREYVRSATQAPIQRQEVWACGVTYLRSKTGRQEESKFTGGSDFYAHVYEADRPEIFFKATAYRTVGPGEKVNIRKDSSWNVPEPELTLVVTTSGKIVGYTIGNDMSSRSIEGENPLYLPQAKTYDASAAVGPCIYVTEKPLPGDTFIQMQVLRHQAIAFSGEVAISQIRREFTDLVSYLYRENTFPHGVLVMTGTGIVPPNDFTLAKGDIIHITIPLIGTLTNWVN